MGPSAGGTDNRLGQFFLDQPRYAPGLPVVRLPGRIRLQVVGQADQLEREFGAGAASRLLGADEIRDAQALALHDQRIIDLDARLSQDRQQLAAVPLVSRPHANADRAGRRIQQLHPVTRPVGTQPGDRVDVLISRQHGRVDPEADNHVHDRPGTAALRVFRAVEIVGQTASNFVAQRPLFGRQRGLVEFARRPRRHSWCRILSAARRILGKGDLERPSRAGCAVVGPCRRRTGQSSRRPSRPTICPA